MLDTNHVSELGYGTPAGFRLREGLLASGEDTATTIITVEEQLRGWLAKIHRLADPHDQIPAYQRLQERIEFFARWTVLPWNAAAADLFRKLRRQGVRIGSMDLKIACIALFHDATLLTRNINDFARVPGLTVEDWT
ncbi:MAG: type II toxin-antitoxin system VapC family toxin [Verrucomicrobia bacterium]|nr:type II toxin-antitoxin system VapC family toxin [Verrucomicrobiota bacterium]